MSAQEADGQNYYHSLLRYEAIVFDGLNDCGAYKIPHYRSE
ncbi:hypothetical protein [Mucilaginibacter segetis]|nr:hypothetical protein [Mucilaginibacter segetis]